MKPDQPPIRTEFASDPFMSSDSANGRPKSLEEIMQGLGGYRARATETPAKKTRPAVVLTELSAPSKVPHPVRHKPVAKPIQVSITVTKQASPQITTTPSIQSPPTLVAKRASAAFADLDSPTIDIRDFATEEPVATGQLEPIRGAFELDPDFFDFNKVDQRLEQLAALEQKLAQLRSTAEEESIREPINLPSSTSNPEPIAADTITPDTITPDPIAADPIAADPIASAVHANQPDLERDQLAEVVWAQDQQVIYVDGKEGYQYIDLTCFDIRLASFEGNRIRIRAKNQSFEIDYRNVTHVLFADGQEVELAAFEDDFTAV